MSKTRPARSIVRGQFEASPAYVAVKGWFVRPCVAAATSCGSRPVQTNYWAPPAAVKNGAELTFGKGKEGLSRFIDQTID
jgi:hypothetical protein